MEKTIIYFILILGGVICLQIYLSRQKNRWYGLILPSISFLFSLVFVGNLALFDGTQQELILMLIGTFLIGNVLTLLLLALYFSCRKRQRVQAEVEKMSILDL